MMHITKSTFVYIFGMVMLFLLAGTTYAQSESRLAPATLPAGQEEESVLSAFQHRMSVDTLSIVVPTVVEVPINNLIIEREQFAVLEEQTGKFVSNYFEQEYRKKPVAISVESEGIARPYQLVDGRYDTSVDFLLPTTGAGEVEMLLTSVASVRSSALIFDFAQNVAMPTHIEIRAVLNTGREEIIVARKKMTSKTISFPETSSTKWRVTLSHVQPLRINEIRLVQDDVEAEAIRGVRFLAQPDMSYVVYLNPDRPTSIRTTEGGDLRNDENVRTVSSIPLSTNPLYREADTDEDGIRDVIDNCVYVANTDQGDIDGNGLGDVCEDFDRDGVANYIDNCPNIPNKYQKDEDGDAIGDVCDDEESRLTEKYAWIPWVGLGFAGLVLVAMFAIVARRPVLGDSVENSSEGE